MKKTHNKSLHWIFTPLRSVKTSEFKRYVEKGKMDMEKEIFLSIDTNILRSDPYFKKSDMDTFLKICKKGKFQLCLSEIVINEYKSQQYEEIIQKIEELVIRFETKKGKAKYIPEKQKISKIIENMEKTKEDYLQSVNLRFENFLEMSEGEIIEILDGQANKVMNDYFRGKLPFKKKKNREDIPDSFIYHFFYDQVKINKYEKYYFISNDEKLNQAIDSTANAILFNSIDTFIKSEEIQIHIREIDIDMKEELKKYISENIEQKKDDIIFVLGNQLTKELPYKTITDELIIDDNNEGTINMVYSPTNEELKFDEIKFINEGMFTLPFECDVEVGIVYYLFKADYYCIDPDEQLKISISDHNDHYFEAEQNFILRITGNISGQLVEYTYEDELFDILDEADFDLESLDTIEIIE